MAKQLNSAFMKAIPKVSVIIVSFNVKQYLLHAINSIHQSQYAGEVEIIIVDNNSFDGSVSVIQKSFPDIMIYKNKVNVGFGKAANQAAGKATGEYLLILNPDTIIQENTISKFVEYLEEHPDVGIIGPKILNADGSLQLACKRSFPTISVALPKLLGLTSLFPKSKWAGKYNLTYLDPDKIHKVDAISGSCMFIRQELFHRLDGFDEHFFMFGEDLDLCYRINQAGYEIHYFPVTQIIHYQGESVKTAPYDSLNAFYNAMILFSNKHFSRSQSILTNFTIRLGISLRKGMSIFGELRSLIISIGLDALVVLVAFLIAIPVRFNNFEPIIVTRGLVPAVYIFFWLVVGSLFQLYTRYILSYTRAILASVSGFFIAVAFTYFFKQYAFSRLVIILATAIITVLIPGWRVLAHYLMSRGVLKPVKEKHHVLFSRKTLIIGTDPESLRIAGNIQKRFDTGLDIIGFCDRKLSMERDELPNTFLGALTDVRDIIKTYAIREIIFSSSGFTNEEILSIMNKTRDLRLTYRMVPRNQEILLGKSSVEEVGDYSFVNIEYSLFHRLHRISKRLFDILGSVLVLIVFSPLIAIHFIFFNSTVSKEYWGENGKRFNVMELKNKNRFLKVLLLMWAVLKGKISFVGSSLIDTTNPDPKLICKPGITGLARVRHVKIVPGENSIMDHYYVQNQSLTLDLEIIMKTLFS